MMIAWQRDCFKLESIFSQKKNRTVEQDRLYSGRPERTAAAAGGLAPLRPPPAAKKRTDGRPEGQQKKKDSRRKSSCPQHGYALF
jgi:hypothetical protein